MVSVLARFWNEIAETQNLKTAWVKRMYTLDQDQINDEIDKEYFQLKAAVHGNTKNGSKAAANRENAKSPKPNAQGKARSR